MPSLTELYLSDTQLPPIIPTISISHINSSTSLAVLHLSLNGLTSSIYPWLELDLEFNQLNGTLPESIGQLAQLQNTKEPARLNGLQMGCISRISR
ncbi:unnamed protein product, partial [Vitis vinifera]